METDIISDEQIRTEYLRRHYSIASLLAHYCFKDALEEIKVIHFGKWQIKESNYSLIPKFPYTFTFSCHCGE